MIERLKASAKQMTLKRTVRIPIKRKLFTDLIVLADHENGKRKNALHVPSDSKCKAFSLKKSPLKQR